MLDGIYQLYIFVPHLPLRNSSRRVTFGQGKTGFPELQCLSLFFNRLISWKTEYNTSMKKMNLLRLPVDILALLLEILLPDFEVVHAPQIVPQSMELKPTRLRQDTECSQGFRKLFRKLLSTINYIYSRQSSHGGDHREKKTMFASRRSAWLRLDVPHSSATNRARKRMRTSGSGTLLNGTSFHFFLINVVHVH